ncbi:THO complex subunit 7 homolog [Trichogramma pretiosum]|uniref:THO complex subunit 7 homolog n=1 Tax=Trichogramma pretiosum TaxID=7493 RepID=UPI0006C9A6AA|nr:THO complex subunit 7 homolog [Trichogramma pretiosum]
MSDDQVIRQRLLIDGDGTGDDRRINVLIGSFMKWVNCPDADDSSQEKILQLLSQCEHAQRKSRIVSNTHKKELNNYRKLTEEIEVEIKDAELNIKKTKKELQEAKQLKRNKTEYNVLAEVIMGQPDRKKADLKFKSLQNQLNHLEEKLEKRRKQFHVLISSIHSIQKMLDDDELDDGIMEISLEDSDLTKQ